MHTKFDGLFPCSGPAGPVQAAAKEVPKAAEDGFAKNNEEPGIHNGVKCAEAEGDHRPSFLAVLVPNDATNVGLDLLRKRIRKGGGVTMSHAQLNSTRMPAKEATREAMVMPHT